MALRPALRPGPEERRLRSEPGSILKALGKITSFNGGNIVTTSNPVARTTSNCYLIGMVTNGLWVRHDDPPISGPTHGYRCDSEYVTAPNS